MENVRISLPQITFHVGKIVTALNNPDLFERWTQPYPYPPISIALYKLVEEVALARLEGEGEQEAKRVRRNQGRHVHLNLTELRDTDYFSEHWLDLDDKYCLRCPPNHIRPLSDAGVDTSPPFVNLGEYAKGIEIESEGVRGVRTIDADEIAIYWVKCPETIYNCRCKLRSDFGYQRHLFSPSGQCPWQSNFSKCSQKRVSLPEFYRLTMQHFENAANKAAEETAELLTEQEMLADDARVIEQKTYHAYTGLRKILESKHPVHQLFSLYVLGRAQSGDDLSAQYMAYAYCEKWIGIAQRFWGKGGWDLKKAGVSLEEVENRAREICITGIMGNSVEVVKETRVKESPFSGNVFATVLNPKKLQVRYSINRDSLPFYTAIAMLIYLTNIALGHNPANTEPIFTNGNGKHCLEVLSDNQLGILMEYCAHILFLSFLPDVTTAWDFFVNLNRFNPKAAEWNLDAFFEERVNQRLQQAYIAEGIIYTKKKKKRIRPVRSLNEPTIDNERKETYLEGRVRDDSAKNGDDILHDILHPLEIQSLLSSIERLSQRQKAGVNKVLSYYREHEEARTDISDKKFAEISGLNRRTAAKLRKKLKEQLRPE